MLELEAVSKLYGRRPDARALDSIELVIGRGEFVVVAGPCGAGKTTLARLLTAELLPTEGTVRLFGHDVSRLRRSSLPKLRRRIGVVRQRLALLDDRTALDNVSLPLEVRAVPRPEIRARAAAALASVGLAERVDARIDELSAGAQARVALARALVSEPAVLIADEPTGALDTDAAARLLDTLRALHATGVTVVVLANDRDVLAAAARHRWRTLFLEDGRLRAVPAAAERTVAEDNVVPFPLAVGGTME